MKFQKVHSSGQDLRAAPVALQGKMGPAGTLTVTGHGLKDPDMALASSPEPTVLPATYQDVEDHILKVIA